MRPSIGTEENEGGIPVPTGSRFSFDPCAEVDEAWMRVALTEARAAAGEGEVPVGAVLVGPEGDVARGRNRIRATADPIGHAEILTLRAAAALLGDARLIEHTLYVTLEPCAMCAGGIVLSRVRRVVFGAWDPKAGMCGSLENLVQDPRLNHRVELLGGVLAEECGELLRRFFRERRRVANGPDV